MKQERLQKQPETNLMAYYPRYIADHNGRHEIFKDMPTLKFDGVFKKAFNESKVIKDNEETQLDRIERKQDEILRKLELIGSLNENPRR